METKKNSKIRRLIRWLLLFQKKMKYDRVDVYAAQASFYLVMSAVPILMLLFTLIKYTPLTQEMVMETLGKIINEDIMAGAHEIIGNVYDGSVTLISFAAVSLLWVAGKGILGMTNGLNNIHRLRENRNYFRLRLRASLYTLLMIMALILAIAILIFGFRIQEFICELFPLLVQYQQMLVYLQTLIALCLLTFIFTAMYVFLPNRTKTFASQFPGAVFATLSWCIFSFFFSIYLDYAKNMSLIYGGLVTVVVIMLWLYACMYLWFIGAEINAYLEKPETFAPENLI